MSNPSSNLPPAPPSPPASTSAGKPGRPPESKVCPTCGGTKYKRVAPAGVISFANDRVCIACNTKYAPPTPLWAGITFIVIGGALTLFFGLLSLPVMLALYRSGTNSNSTASPVGLICPASLCIMGVLAMVHGIKSITK